LVVDTSILVGELLRGAGRRRLGDERLDLFTPEQMRDELSTELPRRLATFAHSHRLSRARADELLIAASDAVDTNVGVLDESVYRALEDEATWRCVRDTLDWPLVACALSLETGVWTNGQDLFGTGVATWVSQTVQGWLDHQPAPPQA
jgi:predicted nucleic acid-binding protein